tara:strand:+ start:52232 stop:54568 length:2337 start_codon:yes stop_codon:yes gene_type:complete
MLLRIFAFLFLPFFSFSQSLGPYENLGFYGGYTWDFHVASVNGKRIIMTAQSGGNQIYYSQVSQKPNPEKFSWQKLPATNLSKTSDIEAHSIAYHKSSGKLFFRQGYTRILRAGITDEFAKPFSDFGDFKIVGDTLVSLCHTCGTGDKLKRYYINNNGDLTEISEQDLATNIYPRDINIDPRTGKVVFLNEQYFNISDEPYYSPKTSLNFTKQINNPFPRDTTNSKIHRLFFHIDQKGNWWLLKHETNFGSAPNFEISNTRTLALSKNEGQTWSFEDINLEWPNQPALPPNISTNFTENGKLVFSVGNLYRLEGQAWKTVGRLYNPDNIYLVQGPSYIDPVDASIAYHSSNLGPAMSTHYGDSLFLLNKGLDAAMLRDINYYPKSRTMLLSSVQRIGVLRAVGLPQEEWTWLNFPERKRYRKNHQVAFNEEENWVYFADDKLYRQDLDGGNWKLVFDPNSFLESPINDNDLIQDLSLNPDNPSIIALSANMGGYRTPFILLSQDNGETWDSLGIPNTTAIWSQFDWQRVEGGYKLYLTARKSYSSAADELIAYYFIAPNDTIELRYEKFPGLTPGQHIIEYQSSSQEDSPQLAIAELDYKPLNGDIVLGIKRPEDKWDTIRAPIFLDCFICYDYPRAVVAFNNYAFMSFGHLLYAFDIRPGQEKLIGEISALPRLENILKLEVIDNYLYTMGIYGLYRQKIDGLAENPSPIERWALYPNPSEGKLIVQPPAVIQVYDLKGGLLYESKQIEYQVDLSHLQPGLYLVKHPKSKAELWRKL